MVFILFGLLLAGIGIGLLFVKKGKENKALNMRFVETSTVKDLKSMAEEIIQSLGAGNFTQIVELKGKVVADEPIQASFSHTECVYYSAKVEREYEVEEEEVDEDGNRTTRMVRRSEVVSNDTRSIPFYLDDDTDRILIDLAGQSPESIQTHSRFEKEAPQGFNFSISNIGSKTLGYKFTEYALPIKEQLYVLGEAHDRDGQLKVSQPLDKENSFIVSTKSEEQLVKSAESSAKGMFYGGTFLISAGVGAVGYGIYKMIVG